ncbi:MAG: EamA family transporter RarD [Rubrivivax sp.]|nr:EamA family transporter RarD [Rubrivivax sp.]MDP3082895.1 EamA family transporter RarD [Rubrivivax sp.]
MPSGVLAAALAFVLWGLFPIYIKQLAGVPALEIVVHRTVWSLLFMVLLLAGARRLGAVRAALSRPRTVGLFVASGTLLAVNWLVYVWAVSNERIVDASLGYFINPLISVLLGYVFLQERLRPAQWLAVLLAGAGVLWLIVGAGEWPWVALVIAGSFGLYGLLRKTAPLGATEGLGVEAFLQSLVALPVLLWWTAQGQGVLAQGATPMLGWLLLAGPFTAIPLLLFAAGARSITLATLGLLQYLGPSLQFLLGVWLYGEAFGAERAAGFVLIWSALLVYSIDGLRRRR